MSRLIGCGIGRVLLLVFIVGCGGGGDQGPVSYAVQLAPTTLSLALGGPSGTATISAKVTRANISDNTVPVAWTTSDASVATVSSTGQVATIVGTGHGIATITATVPGSSARTDVTVVAPVCVFDSSLPAISEFGTPVTAALSGADCRRGDLPTKGYLLSVGGPGQDMRITMSSSSFSPKLAVLNSARVEVGSNSGAGNTACLALSLFRGTYFVVASAGSSNGKGSFTFSSAPTSLSCN